MKGYELGSKLDRLSFSCLQMSVMIHPSLQKLDWLWSLPAPNVCRCDLQAECHLRRDVHAEQANWRDRGGEWESCGGQIWRRGEQLLLRRTSVEWLCVAWDFSVTMNAVHLKCALCTSRWSGFIGNYRFTYFLWTAGRYQPRDLEEAAKIRENRLH